MATLAMVAIALLAILVFVLSGALLEMFKDIRQLRDVSGILDRPLDVDVGRVAGTKPSEYGLPAALDSAASAIVLFLSDRCGTCRSIAASFDSSMKAPPPGLWIVLEGRTDDSVKEFLNSCALKHMTSDGRVMIDVMGDIARRMGLDTSPVGFRVEKGALTSATTVPSTRYLVSILPKPIRLKKTSQLKEAEV